MPDVTGQPQLEARTALERGGFEVGVDQQAQCADPGIVFEQSPPPGELVDEGSRVNLVVSAGQQVRVPELAGSQLASARMALSKRDLLADATEQRSSRVDEGRVISSAPIAGEQVACKSTVGLAVSSGVRLATVPDLLGSDQGAAESALRRRGFIADVEVTDSDEPEGTVLEQSPPGGAELRRGGRVTITVSSGAGSVIVPDVVGQPEDTAIAILTERGATDIRVVRQISEVQADDGRVTDQAPSAGSRILAGERVTIFVASFQEPPPEQTTTSTTSTTTEPPPATTSTTTSSTTTSEPPP
ncbi:MAG: PASTA domain-containing protein [Solirubrobacterales bacterium]|nr:PASTA domain-containing protein [Solirubrobacterales bacterium]